MQLINSIIYYMNIIGGSIVVGGILCCGILFYFVKVRKVAAKVENINTASFVREDSISYVPIKDMLYDGNIDGEGIIAVTDTLFVAGISVRGFNYANASAQERLNAQLSSTAFFNVVDGPVTFRESVKTIDLEKNIIEYEQYIKDIATELMTLDAAYQDTLEVAKEVAEADPDSFVYYRKQLDEIRRKIDAKTHQEEECSAVVSYMKAMEKDSAKREGSGLMNSQIMFSYEHNPDFYSTELTKEEIYVKAKEELHAKARKYMDALANCNFRSTRLSLRELIRLIRQHNFPITGTDGRLEDLLDSSYASLFISSDSLVEAQRKRIGEEEFQKKLKEYEENLEQILEQQRKEMEETKISLYEESLLAATGM